MALDNNLTKEDVLEKVPASGPKGRVLKGDILAYLGKIPRADVDSIVTSIQKLEHLDLSKISLKKEATPAAAAAAATPAAKPEKAATSSAKAETSSSPAAEKPAKPSPPPKPQPTVLSGLFTLSEISSLQEQLKSTIGSSASTKSLVEKASKLALKDTSNVKPKKSVLIDPVFEEIIAPSTFGKTPFTVSIGYPKAPLKTSSSSKSTSSDIYDILTGVKVTKPSASVTSSELLSVSVTVNDKFPGAPEKAKLYLDRFGFYLSQGKGELLL